MTVPIELAPAPRARRVAVRVQFVLAGAIVAAVIVQIYLIGAYIFGAGQGALDAHRSVASPHMRSNSSSWSAHWSRGATGRWLLRWPSSAPCKSRSPGAPVAGGLHPLFAMIVLALAGAIATRAWRAR